MKKRLIGMVLCVSMLFVLCGSLAPAYAAETLLLNDFNGSVDTGWKPVESGTAFEAVESTNLFPSGKGVSKVTENKYTMKRTLGYDLTKDSYVTYYVNITETSAFDKAQILTVSFGDPTGKNARVNIMGNSNYSGYLRPFMNFGGSTNKSIETADGTANQSNTSKQMKSGNTYQLVAYITGGNKMTLDVYDVDGGKLLGSVSTTATSVTSTGDLYVHSTGIGGEGYMSDLKIFEYTTDEDKSAATKVFEVAKSDAGLQKLGALADEIEHGEVFEIPANETIDGVNVSYSLNSALYDSETKTFAAPNEDTRVFVKATFEKDGVSTERVRAVMLKSQAKTLFRDDFNRESLNNGWTTITTGTLNGSGISKKGGVNVASVRSQQIAHAIPEKIDMDKDGIYYASWAQAMNVDDCENFDYIETGFANYASKAVTKRLTLIWKLSSKARIPVVKTAIGGTALSDEQSHSSLKNVRRATLYNVIMKVEAKSTGNDTVKFKYWPVDAQEPLDWTVTREEEITGAFENFALLTQRTTANAKYNTLFGDVTVEYYPSEITGIVNNVEAAARSYVKDSTGAVLQPEIDAKVIQGGVLYNSVQRMLKLRNSVYVSEITLMDKSYVPHTNLPEKDSEVNVVVKFKNDSGSPVTGKKYLALIKTNDSEGKLKQIKCSVINSDDVPVGTGTKNSSGLALTVAQDEIDKGIKLYVWDLDTLLPVINGVTLVETGLLNY